MRVITIRFQLYKILN